MTKKEMIEELIDTATDNWCASQGCSRKYYRYSRSREINFYLRNHSKQEIIDMYEANKMYDEY